MLSAVTLTPGRAAYLEEQVAGSRDDYYAGRGESPGEWFGAGAALLGLEGRVSDGQLSRLVEGLHPATGERLRRPMRTRLIRLPSVDPQTGAVIEVARELRPVGGFDLVFAAPKSVSLAFALGRPAIRDTVHAAHRKAVQSTLALLEREAAFVRLGRGGHQRVPARGIVAACFTHRLNRACEPHLHTHVALGNLAQGPDGRWRTLDSRALLRDWKLTLGHVYQAVLRAEITERLGWGWTAPVKGLAELDGWQPQALRELSQRRRQVEQHLAARGARGWQAGQLAAVATRAAKLAEVDEQRLRTDWRARLAEHGMGRRELRRALRPGQRTLQQPDAVELRAIAQLLSGPDGLTEKQNTFSRAEALRAWSLAHPAGAPAERLLALTDWYLAQPRLVVPLAHGRYTTPGLLACERRLLALAEQGRDAGVGRLPAALVELAVARAPVALSDEQQAAVRALATSGHAIENLEAGAGAGKTTVAGVLADAYRSAGYDVIGATPTARAARELAHVGIPAQTIDALALRLPTTPPAATPLLVLADENGMAGTRTWAALTQELRHRGAKIIQIGDSAQLPGVPASGAFAALTHRHGAATLTNVRRQRDADEIAALDTLRNGDALTYLSHKLRGGQLELAHDADQATTRAVAWWHDAAARVGADQAVVIVRTNALRATLNVAIRRARAARGALGAELVLDSRAYAVGDRVICRRNDRPLGIDNGTRGTVRTVHHASRSLTIETDDDRAITIPADYLAAGLLEHAYCLSAHALQGATVEAALVVTTPDEHSRRWTYTASSRSREPTRHLVVALPTDRKQRKSVATDVLAAVARRRRPR